MMHVVKFVIFTLGFGLAWTTQAQAQKPPKVHLIWMGGSDCPPCVNWRRFELPKLEKMAEFQEVTFSYVPKTVKSTVPASVFLPDEVKPYKEKLDVASSARHGSPQAAVMVNGEVYDYFHKTRTAEDIQKMLISIKTGSNYPFVRCIKASSEWGKCDITVN